MAARRTTTTAKGKAAPGSTTTKSRAKTAKPARAATSRAPATRAAKPPAPPVKAEAPAASEPVIVVEAAPVLRKKELLERVIDRTGEKKKTVKPIVEAMLGILGEALTNGEELVLPPFGKAKVNRQKDVGSAEMLMVKLRRQGGKDGAADGAADGAPSD